MQRIRDFVKKRDVQMQAEDLSQVIEEAIGLTRISVRDAGLTIGMQMNPTGLQVEIDKIQIQQVLFNLLRNGIEAMQDQSRRELLIATKRAQPGWWRSALLIRARDLYMRFGSQAVSAICHDESEWYGSGPVGVPESLWNRIGANCGPTIIPAEARFSALPFGIRGSDRLLVDHQIDMRRTVDPYQCTTSTIHARSVNVRTGQLAAVPRGADMAEAEQRRWP